MNVKTFQALVVREDTAGKFTRRIETRSVAELPPDDVLIRVQYSSLNYKDALSASGNKGVTRRYPHTPGIDAAGRVAETGEEVLVTGYELGTNRAGGFGQYIRVAQECVVPWPAKLTLRESMIFGTAGFTAAQSIQRLREHGITQGEVLVTGATGGVGCTAVAILSHLGYRVIAVTGKPETTEWLKSIGASEVVGREAVIDATGKPLLKGRWDAVVETAGGPVLAAVIRSTNYRGIVTCCGNVGGAELPLSVYPFILRGVTLAGIDSAQCPMPQRRNIWEKLAGDWKPSVLEKLARECSLDQLSGEINRTLAGQQCGRIVVRL